MGMDILLKVLADSQWAPPVGVGSAPGGWSSRGSRTRWAARGHFGSGFVHLRPVGAGRSRPGDYKSPAPALTRTGRGKET